MTHTTPNNQNFPQFSQAKTTNNVTPISKNKIQDYRINPAIQNRPNKLISVENEDHGIVLTFTTSARSAVLSYTHEKGYDCLLPKTSNHILFIF